MGGDTFSMELNATYDYLDVLDDMEYDELRGRLLCEGVQVGQSRWYFFIQRQYLQYKEVCEYRISIRSMLLNYYP